MVDNVTWIPTGRSVAEVLCSIGWSGRPRMPFGELVVNDVIAPISCQRYIILGLCYKAEE